MPNYFADSSFWIALVDESDQFHERAVASSLKLVGRVLTTQAVLLETANTFSRPAWRERAISLIEHLRARDDIEIAPLSDATWSRGWTLYRDRPDKSWSLTDCISFQTMQERGIQEALAADAHFRQAGFIALLLD
jgi:predicted nucleic acid-binding protein